MMIIVSVRAAGIYSAVLTSNVRPLAIGSQYQLHGHAWDTSDPEGHGVHCLFVDSLLGNVNQVIH